MISIIIQIPFPVSISISSSINIVLLSSLLVLWAFSWFTKLISHGNTSMILFFLWKNQCSTIDNSGKAKSYDEYSKDTVEPSFSITKGAHLILPDDVWTEILCKLPWKHIVRCKSVSKSWNRLIFDVCVPKFESSLYGLFVPTGFTSGSSPMAAWQFAATESRNGMSFTDSCFKMLPFTLEPKNLIDICNGLLLTYNSASSLFYVCNPSTEQFVVLPKCPYRFRPGCAALMFDQSHFNVIHIIRKPLRMSIYSSMSHEWVRHTNLQLDHSIDDSILTASSTLRYVSLDGSLYSVSVSGLIKFDIKQVTVKAIVLPKDPEGRSPIGCIGVSKGRLHYSWNYRETNQILIWMLQESEWVLKHTLSLLDFPKQPSLGTCDDLSLLAAYAFHPTSDVVYLGHKVGIFCYHPESKKLDCVYRIRSGPSITCGHILVFPFSRNLMTLYDFNRSIKGRPLGRTGD